MEAVSALLLVFIIACAVSVCFAKSLLACAILFMAQSLVMSAVWLILESPDLAITEAAVGAGISSILIFAALKRIHGIGAGNEKK